jgi:hypothetical protein
MNAGVLHGVASVAWHSRTFSPTAVQLELVRRQFSRSTEGTVKPLFRTSGQRLFPYRLITPWVGNDANAFVIADDHVKRIVRHFTHQNDAQTLTVDRDVSVGVPESA